MSLAAAEAFPSVLAEMPQDTGRLDDFDIIELARSARRLTSWATSIELGAIAELSARRKAQGEKLGAWDSEVGEWVTDEIAAALTLSCGTAAHRVAMARQLATTLPLTFDALRDGRIDADKTKVIADGLRGLPPHVARAVERQVLPAAPAQTCAQLRYAVRKAIRDIDPDGCAERRELAEDARRLELWDSDAGTSDLAGRDLPAAAATAAWNRINAIVAALKADGDPRTIDQLRADVFLDLLRNERPAVRPTETRTGAEPAEDVTPGPSHTAELCPLEDVSREDDSPANDSTSRVAADIASEATCLNGGACLDTRSARGSSVSEAEPRDGADTMGTDVSRAAYRPERSPGCEAPEYVVRSVLSGPRRFTVIPGNTEVAAAGQGPPDAAAGHEVAAAVAEELRGQLAGLTGGLSVAARRRGGQAALVRAAVRRIKAATAELNARWCTTVSDGSAVRHGADSYRVPVGMRRLLDSRDGTCRFPGCRREAARCDADHTEPHHKGGATCLCNLALLCRRHHRLKQRPEWQLFQVWHGVLVWVAPTGHWYVTGPGE